MAIAHFVSPSIPDGRRKSHGWEVCLTSWIHVQQRGSYQPDMTQIQFIRGHHYLSVTSVLAAGKISPMPSPPSRRERLAFGFRSEWQDQESDEIDCRHDACGAAK